jgi:pyruvate dehydrogenase E1 component
MPNLDFFEPAFVDELAEIMRWGFEFMQAPDGHSLYLRLSTRTLAQPARELEPALSAAVIAGAYWAQPPTAGSELAIVYSGAVAEEAAEAHRLLLEDVPGAGLLAVTSASRLHGDWLKRREASHIRGLLAPLSPEAVLVTVMDGHPATLSWLGAVGRHRVHPLGVDHFGQSGDIPALYRAYRIDADAILDAAAAALVERRGPAPGRAP